MSRLKTFQSLLLPALVLLGGAGCATQAGNQAVMTTISARALSTTAIEGLASVPAGIIANNSGGLISNNGGGLISNNGGGIMAGHSSRYSLFSLNEAPLANALAYLTDPAEQFYKLNGKMITTTTNKQGRYRFAAGVPKQKPVIVNVILSENRRVVGFTVPEAGTNELDISIATTYVTEFLRQEAAKDGKTMADYDLKQLPRLAQLTALALEKQDLPLPDLNIGRIQAMNMGYALVVGQNKQGLGDAWAELLGYRVLASTTVAGSGIIDSGGDGKPALEGEFYRLKGAAVDAAGNIYLADGNHRIRKIDAKTGLLSTVAGSGDRGFEGDGGPATEAKLNHPRGVAFDQAENLYIFDSQNLRVRRVDKATGIITTFVGNPTYVGNGFWENGHAGDGGPASEAIMFSPRSGAFDSAGNLYITDGLKGTKFHTIRKVDAATGVISTFAGVPDAEPAFSGEGVSADRATLNYHNQLWITPNDQLYVADTYNNVVRKIDLKTRVITTVAGIGGQRGDTPNPDGQLATQIKLNGPYGVAVDPKGHVFISERGLHRVLVVKPDGKIYRVAGGGTYTGDGDSLQVAFSEPHDMTFDPEGNLLVTDTRSGKLRRIWTKFGL